MNFKRYTHLLGLCFILVLASCQKDKEELSSYQENPSKELTSWQILHVKADQPVIFHFAKYNAEEDVYSGWVMNNEGEIKKYITSNYNPTPTPDAKDPILEYSDFSGLNRKATEVIGKVNLDELVDNFRLIKRANGTKVDISEAIPENESYTAFYAYLQAEGSKNISSCGGGINCSGGTDYSFAKYLQVFLTINNGTQQIDNEMREAKMITDWLRATNEGLN